MINTKVYIKNKIGDYLEDNSKTIIVLKGIDIEIIDENITIDMTEILKDKFSYYLKLLQCGRKIITYDEYLALYDLILMQYSKILIINNNMFINYYPLNTKLSEEQLNGLVNHYDDDKEGSKYEIGDMSELTSIYGNIKSINNSYYISYNNIISDEREVKVQLFEKVNITIEKIHIEKSNLCYEVIDEEDYINLIDNMLKENLRDIYILEKNTSLSKVLISEKIDILKFIWQDSININIGIIADVEQQKPVRQEFKDILKKYWGYDSFRTMKVYNINDLNNQEKIIEEVSQNHIITNIVEEAEKCINKQDFRDVFVTAPTGAGKSVMFQIPAIYMASGEKKLFTIVISPLIGLMKDQVMNLEKRGYKYVRTMNSDISPIEKQEIINDIADKKCHILYLSPESLLSKSDLEQIIGDRTLGLLIVDEAHIVTTWGKQFRPDYWYLGEHLNKIKKAQMKRDHMSFVICTFTATAIYGGLENMYEETIQSLKMIDPITYLGFIKRDDINIEINPVRVTDEYEFDKFNQLIERIDYALLMDKKMLIYFPTVALIRRFYEHCVIKNFKDYVSVYHGQLGAYEKEENYQKFLNKEAPIMLATKAFGMGIDIDDIEIVAHFSPTGNVCDYVQEIGRAARRPTLKGEAVYNYMKSDFKHINRLHGVSVVKDYQLIEVISKVYELYKLNIKSENSKRLTKKRHEMLVDAESFAHIFENPFFSEDDGINKVKTAMLLIQKDFERRFSFSPFHVRPIPLFEVGFFKIEPITQKKINSDYGVVLQEVDESKHICSVNLKKIWEQGFNERDSFPKFKYMLYSKNKELQFKYKEDIKPSLSINIEFHDNYIQRYNEYINSIKTIINKSIREEKFYSVDGEDGLVNQLMKAMKINIYKAKSIVETIISAMTVYQRDYSKSTQGKVLIRKELRSGEDNYKFDRGSVGFFRWIEGVFNNVVKNTEKGNIYLIDDGTNKGFKETLLILGILETLDILVFKALGGKNSQIYIYVNQTKTLKEIIEKPRRYKNRLLEIVGERHEISVQMLTYIFEGGFTNEKIWELIEDYFLGLIPEKVIKNYEKKTGKSLNLDN